MAVCDKIAGIIYYTYLIFGLNPNLVWKPPIKFSKLYKTFLAIQFLLILCLFTLIGKFMSKIFSLNIQLVNFILFLNLVMYVVYFLRTNLSLGKLGNIHDCFRLSILPKQVFTTELLEFMIHFLLDFIVIVGFFAYDCFSNCNSLDCFLRSFVDIVMTLYDYLVMHQFQHHVRIIGHIFDVINCDVTEFLEMNKTKLRNSAVRIAFLSKLHNSAGEMIKKISDAYSLQALLHILGNFLSLTSYYYYCIIMAFQFLKAHIILTLAFVFYLLFIVCKLIGLLWYCSQTIGKVCK